LLTKGRVHAISNVLYCHVVLSHQLITNEKLDRRKFNLLEPAKELNNVSKACELIGYSRPKICEIRCNYQAYSADSFLDSCSW